MKYDTSIAILFWMAAATVAYVYFGYSLLLRLGFWGRRSVPVLEAIDVEQPTISVIIPAHNEAAGIAAKLKNLFACGYPRARMEILVGSDGSSDSTEAVVRPLASEGVGLISFPQQHGKSAIQNRLVAASSGSILVFTDADCLLSPGALNHIVGHFRDPRIGLVTGRPVYLNRDETSITANESAYLDYETWLREQESERGILAMASGSLFAMRRDLWRPLDPNLGDDFLLPLRVVEAEFRNVLEPRAIATTLLSQRNPGAMLRLKIRIISKDFRALLAHSDLLNPFRHGRTAIALFSHKLLRWLVPYFLIGLFVATILLLAHPFFRLLMGLQFAFYAIALAGLTPRSHAFRAPWSIPASFCLVNLAALLGTISCLAGRTSGSWEPDRPLVSSANSAQSSTMLGHLK